MARRPQKLLHPYILQRKVGEGQFGEVYFATDVNTDAKRAVKVI